MFDSSLAEYEQLEFFRDPATGACGFIAVHSTALGPAMGGLRLRKYPSLDAAAEDVLRLAQAMSYKNAVAGLDLGGGKAVLLDDDGWWSPTRRRARMHAVGRAVDRLGGRYITAEDVGTTPKDMELVRQTTRWVAGLPVEMGGRGDPSPVTARTVIAAIAVAARVRLGANGLDGVRVGVQGVGHVGAELVRLLSESGSRVVVTDTDTRRAVAVANAHGAELSEAADFLDVEVDVLAPCGLGEVIGLGDVPRLRCVVIAGAANNPLTEPEVADALASAGILYVPDFVANCGGIIHVGAEALGLPAHRADTLVQAAEKRVTTLLERSQLEATTPLRLALADATRRLGATNPPVAMAA